MLIGKDSLNPIVGGKQIAEAFYKARLAHTLWQTLDYQFVRNPGYNADRGPVHLLALRTHIEFKRRDR